MKSPVTGPAMAAAMTLVLIPAQAAQAAVPDADRIVTTAASERYRAGTLHRWVLGRHYGDLWGAAIRVEVLDLEAFAGGLLPPRTGGGLQTRSLRFPAVDERKYSFRSVDKDPWSLYMPRFVRFEADYPSIKRLHWNGREVDRRLLAELDRLAWDSAGASIQAIVTDHVIERAAREVPSEIYELNGQEATKVFLALGLQY